MFDEDRHLTILQLIKYLTVLTCLHSQAICDPRRTRVLFLVAIRVDLSGICRHLFTQLISLYFFNRNRLIVHDGNWDFTINALTLVIEAEKPLDRRDFYFLKRLAEAHHHISSVLIVCTLQSFCSSILSLISIITL